jgi:hypothetical protein
MLSHSRALIAAALVIGFSAPVMAQQSMRHYLTTSNILMLLRKQ